MSCKTEKLLSRLSGVTPRGPGRWKAFCPAHLDQNPSLYVSVGTSGDNILLSCRAGCQVADILRSLGLGWDALFGEVDPDMPRYQQQQPSRPIDYIFRSKTYAHLLGHLRLTEQHSHDLVARGLTEQEVIAGGYKSFTGPYDTQVVCDKVVEDIGEDAVDQIPGLVKKGGHWTLNVTEGLVIPVTDLNGFVRALQVRTGSKGAKYVTVTGGPGGNVGTPLHVPSASVRPLLEGKPLLVTEGPIKAQISSGRGFPGAVGLLGVDASPRPLITLVQRLRPPEITVAFDMDKTQKSGVAQSAVKLANALLREGQQVQFMDWDPAYNGLDDYLVSVQPGRASFHYTQYRLRGQEVR